MPPTSKDVQNEIMREIRNCIAIDPLASINTIRKYLKSKGYKTVNGTELDHQYITKLVHKLRVSVSRQLNNRDLNNRINELKERYRMVYEKLASIAFFSEEHKKKGYTEPTHAEVLKALEIVVKLDLAILAAELSCGIYEHPEDDSSKGSHHVLAPKKQEAIQGVLRKWGVLKGPQNTIVKNIVNGDS